MDETIRQLLTDIHSTDRSLQNQAYQALMQATDSTVDWGYEAWDGLLQDLKHHDNHVRAIAGQLLSNLAKSDPQKRMLKDFAALLEVTKDLKFVTARHTMQSLWKIGAAGGEQRELFIERLSDRFAECIDEKNGTLIRYDIIVGFRQLYEATGDARVKTRALELVEIEEDLKYRKKYTGVLKK